MAANPEFMTVNLVDTATLGHSSEESSLPAENIQSPFRTKVWRSDSGWNIVAGINDAIDFDDGGGEENVTLDAGNYAASALMAAEIKAQMETATGDTITVTYSGGRKFTIASDGGTLELLWDSGTNTVTSCGEDIGFDTTADNTGATSYEADGACRCSREWIGVALAAATQCKRCAIVSHNFSSSAVITLYRHTSDDLSAATAVDTITYDADFMILEFSATYRYWWIHVDDIDNSDSYIEVGRAFLGTMDVLTAGLGEALTFGEPDPSVPVMSPEGAVGKHERDHYFHVAITLRLMNSADRDILLTIYGRVGVYEHMFIRLDPGEATFSQGKLGGFYGYFTSSSMDFSARALTTIRYTSQLVLEEAR